ncbi:MAG TPA: hypothetical protein VG245_09855 [Candidatus Dormibacteraeota bacterium]|nr:hypothetical protein [Candidatus Dormibacteraeota bacterium]
MDYVEEPDNGVMSPYAEIGIRDVGKLPVLHPGDVSPAYRLIWEMAFEVGPWPHTPLGRVAASLARVHAGLARAALIPLGRRRRGFAGARVVKSVRSVFTSEWVAEIYRPRVVVVHRGVLNILASWLERKWGAADLVDNPIVRARLEPLGLWPPPAEPVANATWAICALDTELMATAGRHPDWIVSSHELVTADPERHIRDLLARSGLDWGPGVGTFLRENDREGTGWEVKRLTSQEGESWKRRLAPEQVDAALAVIERFAAVELVPG